MSTGQAAAIAKAIQASGTIVKLAPQEFQRLLNRMQSPLIIQRYRGGMIMKGYQYLVSYKGLAFYTRSPDRLQLPSSAEIIEARMIWIP
jgi:hypothetical protein